MAAYHPHAKRHRSKVANRMCQIGNDFDPPGFEMSEAQAPLDLSGALTQDWPNAAAAPVQQAAALVAQHIIARLVASHAFAPDDISDSYRRDEAAVARFTDILLGPDCGAALNWVLEQCRQGASCEAICHDVLAPSARRIRSLWGDDECDYAAFQLGQWRLRRLLQSIDHTELCRRAAHRDPASVILISLNSGESSFEHALVAQYFARSSWTARCHAADDDLASLLQANRFHIAWISIDETARQQDVVSCIRTVRRASQNRAIGVLCGGMELDPMPASWELGADAVAADARTALAVAERWRMWQSEAETPWACVA
jgi:hypothetical protein